LQEIHSQTNAIAAQSAFNRSGENRNFANHDKNSMSALQASESVGESNWPFVAKDVLFKAGKTTATWRRVQEVLLIGPIPQYRVAEGILSACSGNPPRTVAIGSSLAKNRAKANRVLLTAINNPEIYLNPPIVAKRDKF
jgi:hypothetical protein